MTKWRAKMRLGICIVTLFSLFMIAVTWISNSIIEHQVIVQQKTMIGRLYEYDAELCEAVLQILFEQENNIETEVVDNALLEFGYTKEGVEYLYKRSSFMQVGNIVLLVQIGLSCVMLLCVWQFLRVQEMQREEHWKIEIDKIRVLSEKEVAYSKEMSQQFVENIAHQIKTPLACISLSLDMLKEILQTETGREKVEDAFRYLKQIEVLMKHLLDIGRLESGKQMLQKEEVSLEEVLYSSAKRLDVKEERIRIWVTKDTEEIPIFYGDYDWLKEAFGNILKNALEHDETQSEVTVSLRYQKKLIFVQIKDHGEGISQEDIKHIFDRFYLPKYAKKGHTGIGLNLAKLVIEKHFGTIEAINAEGGGTLISICFSLYGLKNQKM